MPSRVVRARTVVAILGATALLGASCTGDDDGSGSASDGTGEADSGEETSVADGFTDYSSRATEYLEVAATEEELGVPGWIAVAEMAERGDEAATQRLADLTPEDFARSFEKLDGYEDTADFDLLYLINLRLGYADALPEDVLEAIDQRILEFKYWYTDSTPEVIDNRWYWSENHRIILHTLELLAGQLFRDEEFAVVDGEGQTMTGADHVERATAFIEEWLDEKAEYGFSEWHSDVYYQKDLTPLLTLAEYAEDEQLAARATAMLDLVLFDLAIHHVNGNVGVTHGRSYAKDKLRATTQDTFAAMVVLYGVSDVQPSTGDPAGVLFSRAENYRLPAALSEVATTTESFQDTEHMGVDIDPHKPVVPDPQREDGLSYTDPEMVPFWWERGALTPWQTVGLTIDTAEEYDLWETELFGQFKAVKEATGGDKDVARELTAQLAPIINIGLLSAVDTRTWRDDGVMLSSAVDFRPGQFGHQYHAWQATLGEEAIVFTTSPGNEPRPGETWPDSDLYWTGGVQPRSLQSGPAAVHVYRPDYPPTGPGLLEDFDYLPLTHAYMPTEAFDEIVEDPATPDGGEAEGSWMFARSGDAYVGLWSHRPTAWRDHTDNGTPTGGLTEPFDLVAEGGADNVWVVEVGRDGQGPGRYDSFEAFMAALREATPTVTQEPATEDGLAGEFTVDYRSPGAGTLAVSADGTMSVDGEQLDLDPDVRFDNPFLSARTGDERLEITAGKRSLTIDLRSGERVAE